MLEGFDDLLGQLVPSGLVNFDGVDFGDIRVYRPAPFRVFENLVLARKATVSVCALARATLNDGHDHADAISLLARRLLDLTAQTIWLTDYEPSATFSKADYGMPDSLLDGDDQGIWPSEEDRRGLACAISAASDWVDAQTLRSLLSDLSEQIGTASKEHDALENGERKDGLFRSIGMLRDQDRMIRLRLAEIGAKARLRPDTSSILTEKAQDLLFFWRVESDVTHGGTAGRVLQRAIGEDPAVGIHPPRWRHAQLITLALDCLFRIAIRCLDVLRVDSNDLKKYMQATAELVERVQHENQPDPTN